MIYVVLYVSTKVVIVCRSFIKEINEVRDQNSRAEEGKANKHHYWLKDVNIALEGECRVDLTQVYVEFRSQIFPVNFFFNSP